MAPFLPLARMNAGDGHDTMLATMAYMPALACRSRAKWRSAPVPLCYFAQMLRRLVAEESTELGE